MTDPSPPAGQVGGVGQWLIDLWIGRRYVYPRPISASILGVSELSAVALTSRDLIKDPSTWASAIALYLSLFLSPIFVFYYPVTLILPSELARKILRS